MTAENRQLRFMKKRGKKMENQEFMVYHGPYSETSGFPLHFFPINCGQFCPAADEVNILVAGHAASRSSSNCTAQCSGVVYNEIPT